MAQPLPPDEEQVVSFFPDPPPFYKYFTTENLERLKQFKGARAHESGGAASPQLSASQLLDLPPELRYLVPPEPPAEDTEYSVFGETTKAREGDNFERVVEFIGRQLWDDLNNQGVLQGWTYEQLYPAGSDSDSWSSLDRQNYLFRFLRSILLSFVELLGIMATNPESEQKEEKLRNIMTLLLNMHALINEYRPHQARETLIGLMEGQLERKKKEVEGVRRMAAKIKETLDGFEKDAPTRVDEVVKDVHDEAADNEERRKDSHRQMWHALDEALGH